MLFLYTNRYVCNLYYILTISNNIIQKFFKKKCFRWDFKNFNCYKNA